MRFEDETNNRSADIPVRSNISWPARRQECRRSGRNRDLSHLESELESGARNPSQKNAGPMRGIKLCDGGALGRRRVDSSAAKTRRANGGMLWPQGRANPAQEHEDRRFATRPLVAARFRKEAVLTLFESVTYLFVPAGTRIPYCGNVLVWAARFFEIKTRVGLFVFPK